ncbi:iron ABC transporter substrate-binding protein [Pseudoclavibacter endophyticus]|uniref:ABC transporter substrate-binding protein n=1 Tax=Pseudoclavibacter endophyticus TaxID=1778590 RepID=A0A6H9WUF2_9MICO|nr:ABC transporter substrate-binding protein [Pseudoclavibacter endophyticus]KAB1650114.1 ABC transporter substrate-binding protein [Pseudoclavibacter endophyticus]GGA57107.1 iron ABC transporter substrate-binding protein [Pseudoclavibacter endophyticus]
MRNTSTRFLALAGVVAVALTGCAPGGGATADDGGADAVGTVTVEDNSGTHEVPSPPQSVVALDNRTFELLSDWGVELSAAAVSLMPDTIGYVNDPEVVDVGTHNEPDLEVIVAAQPDVIISGQRFSQYDEDIAKLVPDATIINLEPRDGEPFDAELRRQIEVLGEIFGKQPEAEQMIADFDAAIERVKASYPADATVMGVSTSGGEIGYLAPSVGRTIGPLFDIFGFTPSLEVDDASDNHMGDDISVEAIAQSNPDWILVMDRDGAITPDDAEYTPGGDLIAGSPALQNVTAVQEGHVVVMPQDTYTNEGMQTYTEYFNQLADAFEAAA